MSLAIPKMYFDLMYTEQDPDNLDATRSFGLLTKVDGTNVTVATADHLLTLKLNAEELPDLKIGDKLYFHIAELGSVDVTPAKPLEDKPKVKTGKTTPMSKEREVY